MGGVGGLGGKDGAGVEVFGGKGDGNPGGGRG